MNAIGKRVFVIGAGASIDHTRGISPGLADFFEHSFPELESNEVYGDNWIRKDYLELFNFVKKYFARSVLTDKRSINVEDLMTFIQIDKQRNPTSNAPIVERQLNTLIKETLLSVERNIATPGSYTTFEEQLRSSDTVITFNWDRLLDRILQVQLDDTYWMAPQRNGGNKPGQYAAFTRSLAKFEDHSPAATLREENRYAPAPLFPYSDWTGQEAYFLKLHGSLDWFLCSNHDCGQYSKTFVVHQPDKEYFCSECHERLSAVLIPPVVNKSFNEFPIIRTIWNIAQHAMQDANEIIVWGYSMPPTDFYSSWLLRQARLGLLKNLTIINPDVVRHQKQRTEPFLNFEYIRRIFNNFRGVLDADQKLHLYEGFQDFASGTSVFNKYPALENRNQSHFRSL